MMQIINIPIEPIEQRYSADWHTWFEEELQKRNPFNHWTIHDNSWMLRKDIKDGAFLDVVGTNHYKSRQIAFICNLIDQGFIKRNERVVFIMQDGWFPVEQLAYMRDMLGCHEWKFVGLFHAGTYDRWDQTAQHGMATWGEDLENSWFKIYDKVIVASTFHHNLIRSTRKIPYEKIEIIPWKVEVPNDLDYNHKENWIVFPHRNNPEKQPQLFAPGTFKCPHGWYPVTTTSVGEIPWTKRRYYEVLAKSKICVSFALQETFGIAMVEAVLLGCIPLVPDRLCYKEMYRDAFRYKGEDDFKTKLEWMCSSDFDDGGLLTEMRREQYINNEMFFPKLFRVVEDL